MSGGVWSGQGTVAVRAPRTRRRLAGFGTAAFELLLRPERYLPAMLRRCTDEFPGLLAWMVGIAGGADSLSMRMAFQQSAGGASDLLWVSWPFVWGTLLVGGFVAGGLAWLIWGWWYSMRLRFCGVRDVDKHDARMVWVHARSVAAIPTVVWLLLMTARHPDYTGAWNAGSMDLTLLVLEVWAVWVGYRGAVACFPVRRTAALVWFLILPLGFMVAVVAIAFVAAVLSGVLA